MPGRPGAEGTRGGGCGQALPSPGVRLLPGAHLGQPGLRLPSAVGVTHSATGRPPEAPSCRLAALSSRDPCSCPRPALNDPLRRQAGAQPAHRQLAQRTPRPASHTDLCAQSAAGRRGQPWPSEGKGPHGACAPPASPGQLPEGESRGTTTAALGAGRTPGSARPFPTGPAPRLLTAPEGAAERNFPPLWTRFRPQPWGRQWLCSHVASTWGRWVSPDAPGPESGRAHTGEGLPPWLRGKPSRPHGGGTGRWPRQRGRRRQTQRCGCGQRHRSSAFCAPTASETGCSHASEGSPFPSPRTTRVRAAWPEHGLLGSARGGLNQTEPHGGGGVRGGVEETSRN